MLRALRWHGKTLATLLRVAAPRMGGAAPAELPTQDQRSIVTPRPAELIKRYIQHTGGNPSVYENHLPPHLFPQWTLGPALKALLGLPYPLRRALNGGCEVEVRAPLPADVPLVLTTRLESIDEDERRVLFVIATQTGPKRRPDALTSRITIILPRRHKGARKEPTVVPEGARELARVPLDRFAGLTYARLTGDFNPIHWLGPYARVMGHKGVILHGFAQLAHAMEALIQRACMGDPLGLGKLEARFAAPLVLPTTVGVFLGKGGQLFVGKGEGERASLVGKWSPP